MSVMGVKLRHRVKSARLLLSPQLQTFGCVALSDVKSQKPTSSSQVGVADYEPPTVKLNLPFVL